MGYGFGMNEERENKKKGSGTEVNSKQDVQRGRNDEKMHEGGGGKVMVGG